LTDQNEFFFKLFAAFLTTREARHPPSRQTTDERRALHQACSIRRNRPVPRQLEAVMQILKGTVNADVLRGRLDDENEVWGHGGADDLAGGARDDVIIGGRGGDRLWGDRGNDRLIGDTGNDTGYGSVDDDAIYGGEGNDWMSGGKNDDSVFGGKDNDELHGNTGNDALAGGSGDDAVYGEAGNDVLFGGMGNDAVSGGSGDDFVMVSSGADTLRGGADFDTLDFSRMLGQLDLNLAKGTYAVGSGNAWNTGTVNGFEHVILNDAGSRVMGSDSHATVFEGGDGADWIRSKLGADVITGGGGADTFAYLKKDTADGSVDTIIDFEVGVDQLDMSDFLKGGRTAESAVRFADSEAGTVVQGLVAGQWVDVVTLAGVAADQVDHGILV
jgi:Ca2+-binding RTX toxin-like protein